VIVCSGFWADIGPVGVWQRQILAGGVEGKFGIGLKKGLGIGVIGLKWRVWGV